MTVDLNSEQSSEIQAFNIFSVCSLYSSDPWQIWSSILW